ncbi:MAG: hypothetical protein A3K19_03615 [Lentisphaerae bacterium RIFOXYB12_FULL_65_16]|nr:MAG: hypothetical protein A3K18_30095 [Lentisphaerae bacterium RIFOXYA12_64_32]OGV86602.1 MAG: hypothetical protein A3K19_03615 [Lentisphaerae bacterium RIFOXYB12_FULL_65_16]
MNRNVVALWLLRRAPILALACLSFAASRGLADDAADIDARFRAAIAAWNAGSAHYPTTEPYLTTFMTFFSNSYLDNGDTKADQRTKTPNDWADAQGAQIDYSTIFPLTVTGDTATGVVNWTTMPAEAQYFHKEGGVWYLYGNQRQYEVRVVTVRLSNHVQGPNDILVQLEVEDPLNTVTGVDVEGQGIATSIALNHSTGGDSPSWVSWGTNEQQTDKSPSFPNASRPAVGTPYTFTIHTTTRGTLVYTQPIAGYLDTFVTNLSPVDGGVVTTATPTFSWTGLGEGYTYSVNCNMWNTDGTYDTSVIYGGAALAPDTQYQYQVEAWSDAISSASRVTAYFTYTTNNKYIAMTGAERLYTEGDGAVVVDSGLVLTNNSGLNVGGASVWISANYVNGQDVLGFNNQNGITGSFSSSTGTLTLTGTASTAAYETALRSVTFNTGDNPLSLTRFVAFQFKNTSDAQSAVGWRLIQVTPVNDAPTLTTIADLAGALQDTDLTITYETLFAASNAADPEDQAISFRIEAVSTGTLKKGGSAVTPGSTLLSSGEELVWRPASGATGLLNAFTVKAWDGQAASTTARQVKVNVAVPAEIEVKQGLTTLVDGSTTPVSFGTTVQFGSAAVELTFTINNLGTGTLTVGNVTLENHQGFAVSAQPAGSVGPSSSTTFKLQMLTGALGNMAADVSLTNNDSDENPFNFKVSGTIVGSGDGDFNGLDDAWENLYFGGTGVDPNADPDGDGWNNLQEFQRGTNPTVYILPLMQGWNLIALARVPLNRSVDTVLGSYIRGPAWVWQNGGFVKATELEPLRGYWVYAPADVDVPIDLP